MVACLRKPSLVIFLQLLAVNVLVCSAQIQLPDWFQNMVNAFKGLQSGSCARPPVDVFGESERRNLWVQETLFKYSQSSSISDKDVGNGYNVFTEKCCKGQVHTLLPNTDLRCCGTQTYDALTHICCSGVVNKLSDKGKTCCGTATIDSQKEVCCDACAVQYPAARDPDVRRNTYCCGGKPYDNRTQICCQTIIKERSFKNSSCCGPTVFNLDTDVCCFDGSLAKREGKRSADSCCKNKAYDSRTEYCCDGKTVYSRSTTECCGTTLYDLKTQSCCFGKIHNAKSEDLECCGEIQFDKKSKICCLGELYDNPKGSHKCCNNYRKTVSETYDPKTEVCCEVQSAVNKVFPKGQPQDTGCCGNRTYSEEDQLCCQGQKVVQKRTKLDIRCCAGKSFNENTEICCTDGNNEEKYDKKTSGFDQCCDNTPISSTTHTCCGNKHVIEIGSSFSCCDNAPYNTSSHVCCNDPRTNSFTLVKGAFPDAACCGTQLFSYSQNKICCGSTLHKTTDYPGDAICCGEKLYSPKSQVCCAQNVVRSIEAEGPSECCYNFITDEYSGHPRWPQTYQVQDFPGMM